MATNGESTQSTSAFWSHLDSFPVFHDGVAYFASHPAGQKSISVSQSAYDTFIKPFTPYIAKAKPYAGPYITKADSIADSGLGHLETRLPIVKEPTEKLVERIYNLPGYSAASKSIAFSNEKKDHAFRVYSDEYSKVSNGQKGIVPTAKAGFSTSIILTHETIAWLTAFLVAKKEEAKEDLNEKSSE